MYQVSSKIRSFTDLVAWQEGHKLVLRIYKETSSFPSTERFGIVDQMRRASISITSNVAEGFSRRTSKDKQQFFFMALSSVTELQNQVLVARDVQYISHDTFQQVAEQTVKVHKLINGLIKHLQDT